jgi:hypothetical protein
MAPGDTKGAPCGDRSTGAQAGPPPRENGNREGDADGAACNGVSPSLAGMPRHLETVMGDHRRSLVETKDALLRAQG